jgi:hypothetical protein
LTFAWIGVLVLAAMILYAVFNKSAGIFGCAAILGRSP